MKIDLQSGTFLTIYFLTCGVLYLWGFWLYFDLNILQFIDVSDIIKATILPMIGSLCLWIFSNIINIINDPMSSSSRKLWKEGGAFRTPVILQWAFFAFIVIVTLSGLTNTYINGTKPEKYYVVGAFISGAVYFWASHKTKIFYEHQKLRPFILLIILFMPITFMHRGIADAKEILKGDDTFLVGSNNLCDSKETGEKFRYIGNLSDKGFAYSLKDNSLCIFKYDYIKLTKEKKP